MSRWIRFILIVWLAAGPAGCADSTWELPDDPFVFGATGFEGKWGVLSFVDTELFMDDPYLFYASVGFWDHEPEDEDGMTIVQTADEIDGCSLVLRDQPGGASGSFWAPAGDVTVEVGGMSLLLEPYEYTDPHAGYTDYGHSESGATALWQNPQPGESYSVSAPGDVFPGFELDDVLTYPEDALGDTAPSLAGEAPMPIGEDIAFTWEGTSPDPVRIRIYATNPDHESAALECIVADDGEFVLSGDLIEQFPHPLNVTMVELLRGPIVYVDVADDAALMIRANNRVAGTLDFE